MENSLEFIFLWNLLQHIYFSAFFYLADQFLKLLFQFLKIQRLSKLFKYFAQLFTSSTPKTRDVQTLLIGKVFVLKHRLESIFRLALEESNKELRHSILWVVFKLVINVSVPLSGQIVEHCIILNPKYIFNSFVA